MFQNKTITLLLEKAKENGYHMRFIVDDINLKDWQFTWISGGGIQLWQSDDCGNTKTQIYTSIFSKELAFAVFGENYQEHLIAIIQSYTDVDAYIERSVKIEFLKKYGGSDTPTT